MYRNYPAKEGFTMKRFFAFALAGLLLLACAACGGNAADPEATEASTTLAATAPTEGLVQENTTEIDPTIQLYSYFAYQAMQYDYDDVREYNGRVYYRVTQPEFLSMDMLALALTDVFSYEIMRDFLDRTAAENCPLYIEQDNYTKLYSCMVDRDSRIASYSVTIQSKSDSKVVYMVSAVDHEGLEEVTPLIQELIKDEDKWVFTDFALDW